MINKQKIKGLTDKLSNALFKFYDLFLFTDIEDPKLKMGKYIRITAYGKTMNMLKYPFLVPYKARVRAFNRLQEQYIQLSGNTDINERRDRAEKYNNMARRITILRICGYVLSLDINSQKHKAKLEAEKEKVIEFLAKSGIKGTDMIERLVNEINTLELKAEALKLSLKIDEGEEEGKKVSEKDYSRMFVLLNKMNYGGSRDMSVIDYINAINTYKQEVEANNKQIEKIKSHGKH